MYYFSESSKVKLATVHEDLQRLFNEVIKHTDCTITSGLRTLEEQQELYAQGRTKSGPIVTNADGVNNKSNHQGGNAVDVAGTDTVPGNRIFALPLVYNPTEPEIHGTLFATPVSTI